MQQGTPSPASGVSIPFNVDLKAMGGHNKYGYMGESDMPPVGTLKELLEQVKSMPTPSTHLIEVCVVLHLRQEELEHLHGCLLSMTLAECVEHLQVGWRIGYTCG